MGAWLHKRLAAAEVAAMNQRIAIVVLAGILLGLSGAAGADEASTRPQQPHAVPDASSVCPQDTGTRLPRQAGDCLSSPGRTIGGKDLRTAGTADVAEALRRNDPSVTITH